MKAIVQDRYGSADVLELKEIERPAIGARDVLVRVRAAGLHVGDWHVMTGKPYLIRAMGFGLRRPKARVRGLDAAGTIAAVGSAVTRFRVGDEVYGVCDGSFAEYARAEEGKLALKPANLTFEQAAAVPTSATAALQALRDRGRVQPGQTVLILGASGGVGAFAVQIAKWLGAEVTGVCSAAKMDLVRALGADHVVDYAREDVTRSGRRYDVILDLGGNRPISAMRRALAPQGSLVLVGGEDGDPWLGGTHRWIQALLLAPFVRQRMGPLVSVENSADLDVLRGLVEAGRVEPVIQRSYDLADAVEAMQRLNAGRGRGKVVLLVSGADEPAMARDRHAVAVA